MWDKNRRRVIGAYGLGIAVLAACTAAAGIFPEHYGKWRDQRELGRVYLLEEKEIEFLNGDFLNLAGRWKTVTRCDVPFTWENSEAWERSISDNKEAYAQTCIEELAEWCDRGLLPLDGEKLRISPMQMCFSESRILLAGENRIPLGIFSFYPETSEDEYFTVILDLEIKKAYYISAFGNSVQDYMAEQSGYGSAEEMRQRLRLKEDALPVSPDVSGMDIAGVCGAKVSRIDAVPGTLELWAGLKYEDVSAAVCRCVVQSRFFRESVSGEENYGLAVVFGPGENTILMTECLYNTGIVYDENWEPHEVLSSTEDFKEWMSR